MYEDKTLVCKDCGAEFVSLPVNRNSMPKRDSRTSPPAARLAVRHVKPAAHPALRARCMTPSAQNAESPLRFPSSRERIVPYTAASALPPAADNRKPQTNPEDQLLFRVSSYIMQGRGKLHTKETGG